MSWVILFLVVATLPATTRSSPRHLIEFGWDEPTTAFMREHIEQMEKMPFDGTVFHISYRKADGSLGSFMNQCWGKEAFSDAQLQNAVDDLRQTQFKQFKHNFIRFNALPGRVDWFEDYSAVENNARQAARIAALSGSDGVLFDIEQYEYPLFNYGKQKDVKSKSWEVYCEQVRRRGREIMEAFEKGRGEGVKASETSGLSRRPHLDLLPEGEGMGRPLVIMLTFGVSLPYEECRTYKKKLPEVKYGLLVPFLEGMYDAAGEDTKIIDGCELGYGFKTAKEFEDEKDVMVNKVCSLIDNRRAFVKHVGVGFPVWLDFNWKEREFYTKDLKKNYYTPEEFGKVVTEAMKNSDGYVWIYTEKPRWWGKDGRSVDLPGEYVKALREAREKMNR